MNRSQRETRKHLDQLQEKHSFTTTEGARIDFHPEVALKSIESIVHLWNNNHISKDAPPQRDLARNIVPGSKEHAWFLLFMSGNDFRQDSTKLYRDVKHAIQNTEDRFLLDPSSISKLNINEEVNEVQEYFVQEGVFLSPLKKHTHVLTNAHRLFELFPSGDLRLLDEIANHDILVARKTLRKNFKGIGSETSSLLLRYMMDAGMYTFDNPRELSIKVDTHKVRFPFMFQWYTTNEKNPENIHISRHILVNKFEKMYRDILNTATQQDTDDAYLDLHRSLDEGLWRLGQTYCKKQKESICMTACQLYDSCIGRPHINSTTRKISKRRNRLKDRHTEEFVFPREPEQVHNLGRKEIYFVNHDTGKKIFSRQDHLFPFTNVRVPARNEDQLHIYLGE